MIALEKTKLRILVSTPTFLPVVGGAELGIHEIYRRIGLRHDVTILTPQLSAETKNASATDHHSLNYKVIRFDNDLRYLSNPLTRKLKDIRTANYYQALKAQIETRQPDVINFHFIAPHGLALVKIKKTYNIPIALSLVGRPDVIHTLDQARKWYSKYACGYADLLLPNSKFYLGNEKLKKPTKVIPYGVNTEMFYAKSNKRLRRSLGIKDEQIMLFTVSRLAPIKRVDVLIEVMKLIVAKEKNIVLVIGGKGDTYEELLKATEEGGLQANVKLAGYIAENDLPSYFAAADVFVFHSMFETFGIVLAQAMASGLPIVAAATSCIPAIVTDGVHGLLVKPFDLVGFSNAVIRLASDKSLRFRIGKYNQNYAQKNFNWDSIADNYEKALTQLARRGNA